MLRGLGSNCSAADSNEGWRQRRLRIKERKRKAEVTPRAKKAPPSFRGPVEVGTSGSKSTLMALVERCIGHLEGDLLKVEVVSSMTPPDFLLSFASAGLFGLLSTRTFTLLRCPTGGGRIGS